MWKLQRNLVLLQCVLSAVAGQFQPFVEGASTLCSQPISCSSCTARSVCVTNVGIFTNECVIDNVATPYCALDNNGGAVCTAGPTAECADTVAPTGQIFNCTGVGYFPDATNCRRYHICAAASRSSYIMDCPVSSNVYYYNQRTRRCDRSSLSCVPANCQSNSVFVLLGANSLYYALCSPSIVNGVTVRNPTLVLKCPEGSLYSTIENRCVYRCLGEGNYYQSDNIHQYFECYYRNNILVADLMTCPYGWVFDRTSQTCQST